MELGRYLRVDRYGDDRLQTLAIDKTRIWVHWAEGGAVEQIASRYFLQEWERSTRMLRISGAAEQTQFVECQARWGVRYVDGLSPGALYRVEYGWERSDGFLSLYETSVRLPGAERFDLLPRKRTDRISTYTLYAES